MYVYVYVYVYVYTHRLSTALLAWTPARTRARRARNDWFTHDDWYEALSSQVKSSQVNLT